MNSFRPTRELWRAKRPGVLSRVVVLAAGLVYVPFALTGSPIEPQSAGETHPLASKEEMIRDRFQRFQDRVFRLRDQLSQAEPENAARLGRALDRAGELGLAEKLEDMVRMLRDASALDQAVDVQAKWIEDADRLLGILLEQDGNDPERKRELERLQRYQEKLTQLLSQEKGLRSDSAQSTAAQRMSQQLEQAIRRVEAMLGKQQSLSKQAQAPSAVQAAGQQQSLSREAQQLAEDLQRLAELPASENPQPSPLDQAKEQTQSAAQSTQNAASSMSQAGQQMSQGQPSSAQGSQQQAEQSLKEAKAQLEAAKKALGEQQKPSAQQASAQKNTAQQTRALGDQMRQDSSPSPGGQQGQPGEKSDGKSGKSGKSGKGDKKTPGAENLDQAEKEMDGAAESLDQDKPQDATPKQDNAVAELEQAQNALEQAIEQMRKEQREETLRDLEGRFRDMLTKQRPINESTLALDGLGVSSFKRAEELQLAELSTAQRTLAEQAATCLHILDEEGSTIAFPHVVEQLSEDMGASADRLAALDVGTLTQTIEQEIVDTLEQLLEAVKKMQQENEQKQASSGSPSNKEPPLLPDSAELKLLRSSQVRVNTRTAAITDSAAKGIESADSAAKGLRKLAARQVECAAIAKQMRDREPGQ